MLRPVLLIAHRGYSSEAPENTFAAFDLAIARGYKDIEFDIQLSHDGIPVIFHDDSLERTTDGHGKLIDFNYNELAKLDAGSWFDGKFAGQRIPALIDFLHRYQGIANLHIELKSSEPELPGRVIELLRLSGWLRPSTRPSLRQTWRPQIVISSYDRDQLVRSLHHAPRGVIHELLTEEISDESLRWAADHGMRSYHPDGNMVTPELVREARRLKLHVGAWWNSPEEQNVKPLSKTGARYAYVDAPRQHRRLLAALQTWINSN